MHSIVIESKRKKERMKRKKERWSEERREIKKRPPLF
jgi:hypothetical protein